MPQREPRPKPKKIPQLPKALKKKSPPVAKPTPPPEDPAPLKLAPTIPKVEWKPVYYQGRAYVPIEQVASYYDLGAPQRHEDTLTLANTLFNIELTKGQKRARLNGWTFYFSYTVIQPDADVLVSIFDVRNVLDPIMRPNDRRDPAILKTVVLDPTRGGKDVGIHTSLITEKALTLDLALQMEPLLKASGFNVILTRRDDSDVAQVERARITNTVTEEAICVSLRASSGAQNVRGFESSTLPPAGTQATHDAVEEDPDKRFFAGNINDRESLALATTLQSSAVTGLKLIDLGVKRVRFPELRDVNMPAAVCRVGFLSHKPEATQLADPAYRNRMAAHLVDGIRRYADYLKSDLEARRLEEVQRPLRFGEINITKEPHGATLQGEKTHVKLPVIAGAGVGVDRSKVELQLYLFETVNNAEIDMATADPPDIIWEGSLPDWQATNEEVLVATWIRPPFTGDETKAYGKRATLGYIARLIYDGKVMDEASHPANLHRCLYYFTNVFPRR